MPDEKLLSIGEFSKLYKLPISTLRFYHQKKVLMPHCIENCRRYYVASQLQQVQEIHALKARRLPLNAQINSGIISPNLIQQISDQVLQEQFEQRMHEPEIFANVKHQIFQIEEKSLDSELVTIYQNTNSDFFDIIKVNTSILYNEYLRLGCTFPDDEFKAFILYKDLNFSASIHKVDYCKVILKHNQLHSKLLHIRKSPAYKKAVCLKFYGIPDMVSEHINSVMAYIREHNYHIIGPLRVYLIITLHHTFNANNWLSEIQIPIE